MKPYLLITLLLCSIHGFGQPKYEYGTAQGWNSGFSYAGGTKFRICVSGSKDVIESIDITSVVYRGYNYGRPEITKLLQPKDSTSYMFIEFSYSYNRSGEEQIIKEIIEKPKKLEEGIFYTLHGVNAKIVILKMEDLIPIGYP